MNRQEIWLLAHDHQQGLRDEAARNYALTNVIQRCGAPRRHVLAVVGDLLISAGTRLRARYDRKGDIERPACDLAC